MSLDVLRGFAILGILVVNIQSFGLIGAAYLNPTASGELIGGDYWGWWLTYVFFDSKFMAIFSLLFGAGIVLMWERASKAGRKSTWIHYRRMFWLMLFGLAHAHLLWFGDILFLYSICGMVVYWVCGWKARWLIPLGVLLLMVGSSLSLLTGWSMSYWDEAQLSEMMKDWKPSPEQIENELAIYRGSWLTQLPQRSMTAFFMETFLLGFWGFWRAGGLMLIGMGLYKTGVFNAQRTRRFYQIGMVIGAACGLAIILWGVQRLEAKNWSLEYSFFIGNQFNYWGSLLLSFAYVCLVMLVCRDGLCTRLQKLLAAVGQMALTNYLLQTIVCTTLFYGHGLGWFGYLNRVELIGIVVVIWAFQLAVSPIWLRRFRFGPFEWFWRTLTYWKLQPIFRVDPSQQAEPQH